MKKANLVEPKEFVKHQKRILETGFQLMHQKGSAAKYMEQFPEDTFFVVVPVGAGVMADSIAAKLKG